MSEKRLLTGKQVFWIWLALGVTFQLILVVGVIGDFRGQSPTFLATHGFYMFPFIACFGVFTGYAVRCIPRIHNEKRLLFIWDCIVLCHVAPLIGFSLLNSFLPGLLLIASLWIHGRPAYKYRYTDKLSSVDSGNDEVRLEERQVNILNTPEWQERHGDS